jgi:hypothetical protein
MKAEVAMLTLNRAELKMKQVIRDRACHLCNDKGVNFIRRINIH